MLVRVLPLRAWLLWSLAGALYPAVDLCAGEKERGTMGDACSSAPPAARRSSGASFLTIWVLQRRDGRLLNLLSMALTTWAVLRQ